MKKHFLLVVISMSPMVLASERNNVVRVTIKNNASLARPFGSPPGVAGVQFTLYTVQFFSENKERQNIKIASEAEYELLGSIDNPISFNGSHMIQLKQCPDLIKITYGTSPSSQGEGLEHKAFISKDHCAPYMDIAFSISTQSNKQVLPQITVTSSVHGQPTALSTTDFLAPALNAEKNEKQKAAVAGVALYAGEAFSPS